MSIAVVAPVAGRVMPLSETPDQVFAGGFVGPGVSIDPARGEITAVAAVSGEVVKMHPHAYVVQAGDGAAVLVHLGIDTVQMKGEGFTLHVAEGDKVTAGQPVVTWNTQTVVDSGRSAVCPVVALEGTPDSLADLVESGDVEAGQAIFTWNR